MAMSTLERDRALPSDAPDPLQAFALVFAKSAMVVGAVMCLVGALLLVLRSLV
jgi:hypothetical protein